MALGACVCLVFFALPVAGQSPANPEANSGGEGSAAQTGAPGRLALGTTDWLLGGVVVSTFALIDPLTGLDRMGSEDWSRVDGKQAFFRIVGRDFGNPAIVLGATGSAYLAGKIAKKETLARIGLHSLAGYLAAGVVTHAIKAAAGRARPYLGTEPDLFEPFTIDGDYLSFPSGHSSGAFVIATILSSELGERHGWVPYVAYPMAAWTATTRVLDQRHWVTDIVAGSALGILTGRLVERALHWDGLRGDPSFAIEPTPAGALGVGLRLPVH